jgi:folylpolyglutamate synthase
LFREVEEKYLKYSAAEGIKASEFEVLTATAFDIFTREEVDVAVVEVGMGGRLDATNVLPSPLVAVISKISLDHQSWLGNTLEDIAREKAGILKPGVPCIVDHTNVPAVKQTIEAVAAEVGAGPIVYTNDVFGIVDGLKNWKQVFDSIPPHQQANTACAWAAVHQALQTLGLPALQAEEVMPGLKKLEVPGRLQKIQLKSIVDSDTSFLLDGAHNADSARVLGEYVASHFRNSKKPPKLHKYGYVLEDPNMVVWVLAMTEGKDAKEIIKNLNIKKNDQVITVEYGPVEGMPWVRAMHCSELRRRVRGASVENPRVHVCQQDVVGALRFAAKVSERHGGRPVVIAGSLYLASDVLRLQRDFGKDAEVENA